jgi:predicted nucleotidyltransferase
MDFARPIEAVIPGAQGKLLAALARITGPVTLRAAAELAGVSTAQCSRVLGSLVELGIVEREDVPPAAHFRLVRDHVAAQPLLALLATRDRFLEHLGNTAARIRPSPISVVAFGSLVRGEATIDSDIDVLLVRSSEVAVDDSGWRDALARWAAGAERASGNPVNLLEVDAAEARRLLRSGKGVWSSIRSEGHGVFGQTVDELRGGRRAAS